MGIIVANSVQLKNGIKKQNCYFCVGNEPIITNKISEDNYVITTNVLIYYDKNARATNSQVLERKKVSVFVNETELSTNAYTLIYDELKKQYPFIKNS